MPVTRSLAVAAAAKEPIFLRTRKRLVPPGHQGASPVTRKTRKSIVEPAEAVAVCSFALSTVSWPSAPLSGPQTQSVEQDRRRDPERPTKADRGVSSLAHCVTGRRPCRPPRALPSLPLPPPHRPSLASARRTPVPASTATSLRRANPLSLPFPDERCAGPAAPVTPIRPLSLTSAPQRPVPSYRLSRHRHAPSQAWRPSHFRLISPMCSSPQSHSTYVRL
jgi:hypothetical protein